MRSMWDRMKSDYARIRPSSPPGIMRYAWTCLGNPGLIALTLLRVQESLVEKRKFHLAALVRGVALTLTGADFVPGCRVGYALMIQHPNGIVIGAGARIGDYCTLLQQVTLGERYADGSGRHDYPTIGSHVTIGAGAKVLGDVSVGEFASVGANSVVLTDVPARAVAVGSPARVLSRE